MDYLKAIFNVKALDEVIALEDSGSPGLMLEVLREFDQLARELLVDCKSAAAAQDWVLLERSSHSLKSSSALLGLERLAYFCAQIEEKALGKTLDVDNLAKANACLDESLHQLNLFMRSRYPDVA